MKKSKVTTKSKSFDSKVKSTTKESYLKMEEKKKRLSEEISRLTNMLNLKEMPSYTSTSLKVLKAKIKQKITRLKAS
jgi:hypothetical protein